MFRRRRNRELDEEIAAHLNMAIADRVARGESPEAARLAAMREFGNQAMVKEVTRAVWGWAALEQAARDLALAARMPRKNPAFAAVVVLTLALGVGANSAVFSVARRAFAPLPVPHADRVVFVWTESAANHLHQASASEPDFAAWKASGIFASLGAFVDSGFNVRLANRTERDEGATVDDGFFEALGVQPELGRLFSAADVAPGAPAVTLLSDSFWRSHFAGDPGIVGKPLVVNGKACTVIGVLPRSFAVMGTDNIYMPLALGSSPRAPGNRYLGVLGRLRPGLSLEAANQLVAAVEAGLGQKFPDDRADTVVLQPIAEGLVEDSRTLVILLMGAVGFVLLITCANLANLLMARGTARTREMAVRAALGASRWQLTRQLLAESLLLAAAGGVAALPAAWLALRLLVSFQFDLTPNIELLSIDWHVLAFHFALALSTGLIFGLLPAWQACRAPAGDALKAASRAHTGGPHQRLRSLLVVAEIAFTVILTTGTGLMLRSFLGLRAMRTGYDARGVLTATVDLGDTRPTPESVTAFFDSALAKARALPGVSAAAAVSFVPASPEQERTYLHFSDRPDPQNGVVPIVVRTPVTPDYFRTMRIPLMAGRLFRDSDSAGAPQVAVIDERAAREYWPGRSPVGERIWIDLKGPDEKTAWRQIVGVAGSVTIAGGLDAAVKNAGVVYLPESQYSTSRMTLVLRTSGRPSALAEPLRRSVREVDIDQPLFGVETLEDVVATGRAPQKLALWVLAIFGGIALLLSAIGIYGVMAFSVGRRRHEFGIRMSLGARPRDVLKLVTRQAFLLNMAGVAIGLSGAWAITGLMSSLLYGVRASDPATFAASIGFLAVVTMVAAYVPARRATRVDPAEALREE